jgi:hypothetical protein
MGVNYELRKFIPTPGQSASDGQPVEREMVRRLAEPTTPVSPKVNERKNAAALIMNRSFETGTFTTLDARTRRVRRRLGIPFVGKCFGGELTGLRVHHGYMAMLCCLACRSQPTIFISASFAPSLFGWIPQSLLGRLWGRRRYDISHRRLHSKPLAPGSMRPYFVNNPCEIPQFHGFN